MHTKSYLTLLAAIAAVGFAAASQSAFAQSDAVASVTVHYSDLNLSSASDAKVMLMRIRRAAKSVCGPEPTSVFDRVSGPYRNCISESVDRAIGQLNSPLVTVLASAKPGSVQTALASAR